MFGLFFEVIPKAGHAKHYFDHVAALREELLRQTALVWLERFSRRHDDIRILSHQLWQDMAAIDHWRHNRKHKQAQIAGRNQHFSDYRIRIGKRLGDVGAQPSTMPQSLMSKNTALAESHHLIATAHYKAAPKADDVEFWESVTHVPAGLVMAQFEADDDGLDIAENWCRQHQKNAHFARAEIFAVMIDYGMFERGQAPETRGHKTAPNG